MLFKTSYDKEIHILKSANAKTLHELKGVIPKVFKLFPQNFYLTYLDEEGDQITLATEADFNILVTSGVKSAKIMIREKNEDFYDQTQKIQLEEEVSKEIQSLISIDSSINQASEIRSNATHSKSLDQSIEDKLKTIIIFLLTVRSYIMITKIKKELHEQINQSRVSQVSKMSQPKIEEIKLQSPKVVHEDYFCDGCEMKEMIVGIRYRCSVCNNYDLCQKCEAKSDHPHPFLKIKHPSQAPLKIFVIMDDDHDSLEINGIRHPMGGLNHLIQHGMNFARQFMGENPPAQEKKEAPKQEKKEEKVQTKVEPKVEQKVEPKVEQKPVPTIQEKVTQKVEEKPEQKVETKNTVEPKKEKVEDSKEREQRLLENSNYITGILEIKYTRSYQFAQKYPQLSKEELLELFLASEKF